MFVCLLSLFDILIFFCFNSAWVFQVVSAGKVDAEDVATLKRLACRASRCGREVRSRNSDTWQARWLRTYHSLWSIHTKLHYMDYIYCILLYLVITFDPEKVIEISKGCAGYKLWERNTCFLTLDYRWDEFVLNLAKLYAAVVRAFCSILMIFAF